MTPPAEFVRKPEICGYQAVRSAAKNFKKYSSDLLGDADIRSYRHLPLEADPPRHSQLRLAVQPMFATETIAPKMPQFEQLAAQLMSQISARGGGEVGADFALPYVMGCLGIIYKRPQDVAEWIGWGPDVWTADVHAAGIEVTAETKRAQRERNFTVKTQRSAKTLDDYLKRVFDAAEAHPNTDPETMDAWDQLSQVVIDGARLTREELVGTASVLLSGGRDTVVKLITGFVWHLIKAPRDREYLATHPEAHPAALAELARYLSPLPKMERVDVEAATAQDCPVGGDRVLLSFVSANFDRTIWPDADRLDIHRDLTPNVAFGFGRHSCLGLKITEHETLAFLQAVRHSWPHWQFDGEPELEWHTEGEGSSALSVIDAFACVRVRPVEPVAQ